MFAEIVFPLPFRNVFTYSVPPELIPLARTGVRAVVPFGKRILTGFIINITDTTTVKDKVKPIQDILDANPIFTQGSLKFYEWISDYYLSSLGEALRNSVPYGLDVESKKKIVSDKLYCQKLLSEEKDRSSLKSTILKILSEQETVTLNFLQKEVKKKNIYSLLRTLEKQGAVTVLDELEKAKVSVKKVKFVKLLLSIDETYEAFPEIEKRSPKQLVILMELLSARGEAISLADILKKTNTSKSSVDSLVEKGLLEIFDKEVERNYSESYSEKHQELTLTDAQEKIRQEVACDIKEEKFQTFLLHGVTGSGKTQVYIEMAKAAHEIGKNVLILVPEISLTPQITSRLYNNFGDKVAVVHSRMSLGERYDTWRGIIAGKYSVVVGARSALFAPLDNIGLIVVDEEHDSSYKNHENVPKYQARDAAVIKGRLSGCPVVLGSATPSVESMYNAKLGKYRLLELKERVDDAKLPEIRLVNVSVERKKKQMENVFSKPLLSEIEKRIRKKEGVIILQNRRGFATQVYCEDCGEVETCENCSVPLVFHINRNILQCHYCGYFKPVPNACTHCGSLKIKYYGTGTQRVEDEIAYYFPDARIERIDSDSIGKKGALGFILNNFRKGEIDILVGTQMVSKGLDFSNVTLVGVVAAETSLWLPDFRADERTFQLLTQVSGRAGRSKTEGEVVIQTQNDKHFVLQKVVENDYHSFYEREIEVREKMDYPPFSRLCLIEARDESEENARGAINDFYEHLQNFRNGLKITPPSEAMIAKLKNNYRFHILIKSDKKTDPGGAILRNAVLRSFISFNQKSRFRNIRLFFDIDPQSVV
ncbi:MAG TPA: primosomal protein N' [Ignavibacteriales bacterium]|nr:primosomal protein N' [Ignavibacteriales bacterium]